MSGEYIAGPIITERLMSLSVERLKDDLLRLSNDERADLAQFLLLTLDSETPAESRTPDLLEELDRRAEELRNGTVRAIPAEEVLERLRA